MLELEQGQIVNKIDELFILNVRSRLESLGWNDSKLAKEMKITPQYLHKMLKKGVPNTFRMASMAAALGCSPSELIAENKPKTAQSLKTEDSLRLELYSAIHCLNESEISFALESCIRPLLQAKRPNAVKKDKKSG